MSRILFVDDEQRILDGLRDLLRKDRKRWTIDFALGGEAAIEKLEREPYDVVVSDMRMPRIDGGGVLEAAKRLRPEAGRIILSGQTELAAATRVVPVAHQFLTKPCDGDSLRAVISRMLDLVALVRDVGLQRLVGGIDALPSPPDTYSRLVATLGSATSSAKDIAAVLRQDPALCAKLLQLTNSAFFGLKRTVTSVDTAVALLGIEVLRALVLALGTFASMNASDATVVAKLQDHAVAAGEIAHLVAREHPAQDAVFAAALMHDVGRLLLATKLQDDYTRLERRCAGEGASLSDAELEAFGATHAEVGAYLLGLWGLPADIVEAVRFHHRPWDAPPTNPIAKLVGIATLIADEGTGESSAALPEAWSADPMLAEARARSHGSALSRPAPRAPCG